MRFFQADTVYPLTSDPIRNGIVVCDEEGFILDVLQHDAVPKDNIESYSGYIIPGFVNSHCHLELSHLKNKISTKTGLVDFALNVISKRALDPEQHYDAMVAADDEMFKEGIVAVGDISNLSTSFKLKANSRLYYHTFIELIGINPSKADDVFKNGLSLYDQLSEYNLKGSLVAHAPYSVSFELMKKISNQSAHLRAPISIHNQESEAENNFFLNKSGEILKLYENLKIETSFFKAYGKNSLPAYIEQFKDSCQLILVHNTYSTQDDFEVACKTIEKLFPCVCIKANLFIENRVPSIDQWKNHNLKIVIGTDSLASNDRLSILSELKVIQKNFPQIDYNSLFTWACLNGAEALGINDKYGSIEKGKKPGLVLVSGIENDFANCTVKRVI